MREADASRKPIALYARGTSDGKLENLQRHECKPPSSALSRRPTAVLENPSYGAVRKAAEARVQATRLSTQSQTYKLLSTTLKGQEGSVGLCRKSGTSLAQGKGSGQIRTTRVLATKLSTQSQT